MVSSDPDIKDLWEPWLRLCLLNYMWVSGTYQKKKKNGVGSAQGSGYLAQNSGPVSNIYRYSRDMCLFIELASCQVLFKALASTLMNRHDKGAPTQNR